MNQRAKVIHAAGVVSASREGASMRVRPAAAGGQRDRRFFTGMGIAIAAVRRSR